MLRNTNKPYHDPRAQGTLMATGGLAEVGIGLGMSSTGIGAIGGTLIGGHGLDNIQAGLRQVFTGRHTYSSTEAIMQGFGMNAGNSAMANAYLGMVTPFGMLGSTAVTLPRVALATERSLASRSTSISSRDVILSQNIQSNRAALQSANYRESLAKNFYMDNGMPLSRALRHMEGIDFSKPVQITKIKKGDVRVQYQIPGDPQGNYYALLHADKGKLGIYTSGRQPFYYEATQDIPVLRSYTKGMIDDYSMVEYVWKILTQGGEMQEYTMLKHLLKHVP